jgi:serine phosphatase RsbU (regulator of sigma subunit)
MEAFSTLAVIVALLALLFREQQQTAEDRAMLAGEMQAAREIQRMLAPGIVKTAPGAMIHVAFHPMRDVGGDFFLCPVLPDGRQRVLLGDVSGKGSAAAMTAALLLGGAQARDTDTPGNLLAHLNCVLRESRVGGFATCVCADLAPNGTLTVANAGHLAPYRGGEEVPVAASLPLGLSDATYEESLLELAPGETLTFLSDGVVESRDSDGELFGFERTRAISSRSAEEVAAEAQRFGQEDDITVLTLTRVI